MCGAGNRGSTSKYGERLALPLCRFRLKPHTRGHGRSERSHEGYGGHLQGSVQGRDPVRVDGRVPSDEPRRLHTRDPRSHLSFPVPSVLCSRPPQTVHPDPVGARRNRVLVYSFRGPDPFVVPRLRPLPDAGTGPRREPSESKE